MAIFSMNKIPYILIALIIPLAVHAAIDWNDSDVEWYNYADGIEQAKQDGKKALIIVYADWCGVCKRYSEMFRNPEVVKQAKGVILIRINQDTEKQYADKFSVDGTYIPRTYILGTEQQILSSPYKSEKYGFFLPPGKDEFLIKLLEWLQ